ncbi:hypothetical protein [Parvibaculum sp.]|uniref:hypothetical protein n=1 Tax=Parvibaculum sp. TaxID=2024848 RepID=UPI00391BB1D4
MKLLRLAAIALVAGTAACAPKLETLPVADFQAYKPDLTGVAEPATLRGSYSQKPGLVGSATYAVGVFAINGKVAFEDEKFDAPIELKPGPQSLTIGYLVGRRGDSIPVMLNAKPGGRYVIKRAEDTNWADGLNYNRIRTWLYIEDERTGEIVVPNTPDIIMSIEGRYQPPSGADVATIRGTVHESGLSVYPIAVDGQIVPEDRQRGVWVAPRWEPTKSVALAPGIRAIAILARTGLYEGYLPVLLDAKPGVSYTVKFDFALKRSGGVRVHTHTIWIEDAATGEIVVPKSDLPGTIL